MRHPAAADGISLGTGWFGPAIAFWVLGGMAILATLTTPDRCSSERRAVGWREDSEAKPERAGLPSIVANRKLPAGPDHARVSGAGPPGRPRPEQAGRAEVGGKTEPR